MKKMTVSVGLALVAGGLFVMVQPAKAGNLIGVSVQLPSVVVTPPAVVVAPPAVAVAPPTVVLVPETYTWDGVEFVGEVGGVPVYQGPEGGWHHLDAVRLERFNGWSRAHADWRRHATHNDKFRPAVLVSAPVAVAPAVEVAPVVVTPPPVVVAAPPVVVAAPPVVVAAPEVVLVPETYVWDGVEFVGEVGGVPVFRGPDGGWHHLDAVRLERFNGWARGHADWRSHATHNDKFKADPRMDSKKDSKDQVEFHGDHH